MENTEKSILYAPHVTSPLSRYLSTLSLLSIIFFVKIQGFSGISPVFWRIFQCLNNVNQELRESKKIWLSFLNTLKLIFFNHMNTKIVSTNFRIIDWKFSDLNLSNLESCRKLLNLST